jgi:hypothetical protein
MSCKLALRLARQEPQRKKIQQDKTARADKAAALNWPFVGQIGFQEQYPTRCVTTNRWTKPVFAAEPVAHQVVGKVPGPAEKDGMNGWISRIRQGFFFEFKVFDEAHRQMSDTFSQPVACVAVDHDTL